MTQWIRFFLAGIAETAEKATNALVSVLALKTGTDNMIYKTFGRKSHSAAMLLQAKSITGLSYKAANNLITDYVDAGILKEMTGQSRNRVFVFENYLNLF
jgi:Fic family protein